MGFSMNEDRRYPEKIGEYSVSVPGKDILTQIGAKSTYLVKLHTKDKVTVLVNGNEVDIEGSHVPGLPYRRWRTLSAPMVGVCRCSTWSGTFWPYAAQLLNQRQKKIETV